MRTTPQIVSVLALIAAVGYAAATASKAKIIPIEAMHWMPQAPDLPQTIAELWGDRSKDGGYGELVRLPRGFDSRLHAHSGDFHGVLVAGTWIHISRRTALAPIRRSNRALM